VVAAAEARYVSVTWKAPMQKTNLAIINAIASPSTGERHLGPAEVVGVGACNLEVRLESGRVVTADLALAMPYQPNVADRVLVIGEGDRSWVIGVLSGSGRTVLAFDGDVELRSNDGVLRLGAGQRVEIEAPEVGYRVGTLRVIADSVVEHVASLTQRVRELVSVHAGQRREIIDGATSTQAKSATLVTEEAVKVNGKAIHLG
jgi:hypothetical protein